VFLTGSRGGLVGLVVISIYMFLRSKKKLLAILFALCALIVFYYQGGDTMKGRSTTIVDYQKDSSATDRIQAWGTASSMCFDWPFFGVGLGNFTVAYPIYSTSVPRVAHSTIIQFAAENGIPSALAFLVIFIFAAGDLRVIRKYAKEMHGSDIRKADHIISITNALEGACLGFFVCGLFLCLGTYEIFYYCIMLVCLLKWHITHFSCENPEKNTIYPF
jgi:O-antigen ligase